jgi:hypothetical protein
MRLRDDAGVTCRIAFLLVPGAHLLDLAGPAQVFGTAAAFGLELVGPGALCVSTGRPVVAMWAPSSSIKLPAGGQHVLPLGQLTDGCFWNCYWTEPGRYTLTARLQLGAEVQGTTGPVLVSNPIILDVQ